ncbi:uncharacterized protein Z520_09449 [Fonsecaea multimorphosa CBS 102226]|uniref:Carboxylic ester hydrolase n=1 Tax=Fonsecaea multimorphosa CBS 102226 TaxID=1442371 RepID=A0A0D2JW70_9EURO|nr:uncharacterized protein Z520_09449 [Fonsecaea multimorphosa CBS 102226]KIX94759.1 hypothetical protein Z520_09449 [Fonsecaea multimorphosa CBS 102226]OAL20534.1 hypothetical protein AYO22_08835 [Fonsecaea multimorphosa]
MKPSTFALAWLCSSFWGLWAMVSAQSLPQVDLGYQIQQASSFNATGQVYNFSNIRYAQPPLGKLRFAAPVPPTGRNTTVSDGSVGAICPQADPDWLAIAEVYTTDFAEGKPFNYSAVVAQLQANPPKPSPPDPRMKEDCLFLDVFSPKSVFDKAQNKTSGYKGAPVLVWIYGGGYTAGWKDGSGNPSGLIHTSQANGSDGIVFVELNYRLGAFGWLSGPTIEAADGGVSNAGLYDQRLALEWVQTNIHLFGGDPNRVTVMGESAGGGSVIHQMTAYGGLKSVPFQQAIPQSGAWLPVSSNFQKENTTQAFLALLNVTSIEDARNLPSAKVMAANALQVSMSNYGAFTYGPVVDGNFVPDQPGRLLARGQFASNVKVMAGHNSNEGPLFTDPRVTTNAAETTQLRVSFPDISDSAISHLLDTLYPAKYDGSMPYTTPVERATLMVQESFFTCNVNYMGKAYGANISEYQFAVAPALHGQDVPYTFFNGPVNGSGVVAPVAQELQKYIVDFVQTGSANGTGVPFFPLYGPNAEETVLNVTGITHMTDPDANRRCAWWQQALYY